MTETKYSLHETGRLPLPGDNVAIATRKLAAGTTITTDVREFQLDYTILEGHRFAIEPIAAGSALLSWALPFGFATSDIAPGAYVSNAGMLKALRGRSINFSIPDAPNFADHIEPYSLDEDAFEPADQLTIYADDRTFSGYRRSEQRGVGTRNMIILLGTSSRSGSYVKQLEARLSSLAEQYPNIDGIAAVAHTEGGTTTSDSPNNIDLLLRTLAGFIVHPNVGAVLAVDYGVEPLTNAMVHDYLNEHGYPLGEVPHHFMSLSGSFEASLAAGEEIVHGWLDEVNQTERTDESLSHLKIALQCGGSDAFSGISGNPLVSWVAREVIRYGGAANLAETDELIGAEAYVLQKVRNLETARKFLATIERFKEHVSWHGHTAEGNPSGGNKFRGLYNIVLKSIGAAMKLHPDVRLDDVIDYSEPMAEPGYYFMDSPGNDLESIAGQVAAGCNMIFFVTGNGSITNFPFVPTIKVVTTSRRYRLLARDMDVNSGAYLDGFSMDEVGAQTLDLTVDIASGKRSVGEQAGHAQTQIWREWQQTDDSNLQAILNAPKPGGVSLPIRIDDAPQLDFRVPMIVTERGFAADQVALILPTSLCSGQIAGMTAQHFNEKGIGQNKGLSRFVSLVHTEGCGSSSGSSEELYARTMVSYLVHPLVRNCLLLEHGCEKTHNDHMLHEIKQAGVDVDQLGWASIQLDGGIDKVMNKMEKWFVERVQASGQAEQKMVGLESLRIAIMGDGPISETAALSLAQLTKTVVAAGGTVVAPQNASFLSSMAYLKATLGNTPPMPTISYGESLMGSAAESGFHIMETPTSHWVETLSGIGASGAELVIAYVGAHPVQAHPLVPVLQLTADETVEARYGTDMDLILESAPADWPQQMLRLVADVISGDKAPKLAQQGNVDFQITRGLLGVSM